MPDPIDCPAAPLDAEAESLTPAQQKCLGVPREECEGYPDCRHCPAWADVLDQAEAWERENDAREPAYAAPPAGTGARLLGALPDLPGPCRRCQEVTCECSPRQPEETGSGERDPCPDCIDGKCSTCGGLGTLPREKRDRRPPPAKGTPTTNNEE